MKLDITAGTTSQRVDIFIRDASQSDGRGLTGLTNASSGLAWYYAREDDGNVGGTSVTLASATLGTFTSGGFKEKDSTNLPGIYEIGIPNAALATGAKWVTMMLRGVTNMAPVTLEIQLTTYSPYTVRFKKNLATRYAIILLDTSGTPAAGKTITGTRSIDGGAFASIGATITEIASGAYDVQAVAADLNGDSIVHRFTATGCRDTFTVITTEP